MVERKEYFKTSLDCLNSSCNPVDATYSLVEDPISAFATVTLTSGLGCLEPYQPETNNDLAGFLDKCIFYSCQPDCGSNGVAPCIQDTLTEYQQYSKIVKHGLITWEEGEIYYTPYIPPPIVTGKQE